jgi:RNA polymerase sigma-70 factor, ECF subfamily
MLRNRQDAEDVSQDVFARAVRAVGEFRGDAAIKTWLYQIARNECLTRLAAIKRDTAYKSDWAWFSALTGDNPGADAAVINDDLRKALESAIGELEPMLREALLLRDVEGLSYDEIARVTGTSLATVKTRIHRAREKLKRRLAEFR